jgi:hypothetical protein
MLFRFVIHKFKKYISTLKCVILRKNMLNAVKLASPCKSNFKHTTSIQTPSQNRIKALKDNDEMMQDVSKSVGSNFHADKPAQQSNDQQQRGRQQDRRPSQSQSRSQSQHYRDQSSSSQGRSQSTPCVPQGF